MGIIIAKLYFILMNMTTTLWNYWGCE